jgi:hypothetical protein
MALIFGELLSERKTWGRVVFWSFFWLSTAIKFMSIPLMVLYFYLKKISFRKELTAYIIGFLLIWSVPLAIFRSSLSVSFVFHLVRHVKYASFPSYIVQTINTFTHTESQLDKAPDFPWLGPVNDIVEPIFGVVYPLSLLLVLGLGTVLILRLPTANLSFWVNFNKLKNTLRQLFFRKKISLKHLEVFEFQIGITLIYFLTQFVTGKIFSQPFHIWLVPLVTLFPYKNYNLMAKFMLLTLALLVLDTTGWLHPVYEPIKNEPVFHIAYGAVRFGLIFYMLFEAIKVVGERTKPKSQA